MTETTATGWGTGTLSFTAGQLAQSSSIDYNNGTITGATLTSTGTGTLEYFMNANGEITSNDGTITGATYTTGIVGNYALEIGENQWVDVPNNASFDLGTGDWSLSFWIYKNATQPETYPRIIEFGGYGHKGWSIQTDKAGTNLQAYYGGPSSNWSGSPLTSTVSATTWAHFVLLVSGSNWQWYKNGVAGTPAAHPTYYSGTTRHLVIGSDGGFSGGATGKYDEILLFNRAITPTEVATLYEKGIVTSGLVAKYSFEEGAGTKAFDTANWERVTSGVAHTFEKSGTDLRWKAVENGGAVASITNLSVTGYH